MVCTKTMLGTRRSHTPAADIATVSVLQELRNGYRRFSRFVTCASLLIVVISLFFFISDPGWSAAIGALKEMSTKAFYLTHRHWNDKSAFQLFTNQDPVFTQSLNPSSLRKLLADRRKLRGGIFENSLIAACSDSSAALSTTLLSWNRVRHVRELILVDYDSTLEGPMTSLRLVDSIDKLGRVIYVTVGFSSAGSPLKHIGRARALNLGVAMASGKNIAIVDCSTKVSTWLLAENPLANRSFYTASPHFSSHSSVSSEVNMLYMRKSHFLAVGGFDERIDIPGSEFNDLMLRLCRQLKLRRLSMDSQMIKVLPQEPGESIMLAKDSTLKDAEDIMERARRIPKLSGYISALARRQLPAWNGRSPNSTDTILDLVGLKFTVLRQQLESARHHPPPKVRIEVSPESDYRLWVHVAVQGKDPPVMLDLLPEPILGKILLNAHQKLLHDEYKVPWDLLAVIDKQFRRDDGDGSKDRAVMAGQIMNYSPLLFDVVWRRKKLLVVNIDVEDAMELLVSMSWAVAYAVSKDRSLVLVGHLCSTPIAQLLDFYGMRDILHREYNLKVNIMGGGDKWDCRRGPDTNCWSGDRAATLWDEYNLTREPSGLRDNANRHNLFNIVSARVTEWGGGDERTGLQMRLQRQAFASVCVSRDVGQRLQLFGNGLRENINEATAVVIRGKMGKMGNNANSMKTTSAGAHLKLEVGFVSAGGKWFEKVTEKVEGVDASQVDGFSLVAELWMVLQCRGILFDSGRLPKAWQGEDANVLEWRRIHSREEGEVIRHSKMEEHGGYLIRFEEVGVGM